MYQTKPAIFEESDVRSLNTTLDQAHTYRRLCVTRVSDCCHILYIVHIVRESVQQKYISKTRSYTKLK